MRFAVLAVLVASEIALAQGSSDAPTRLGPNNDPNQIVCRTENRIGTRLSRTRVCRTRAEWDQLREQERRVVDRVQHNKQTCGDAGTEC